MTLADHNSGGLLTILKGILHPKMKILSSFTHLQVVANHYEFLSSAEHKGRYFEERLEPNSYLAPLTSIVKKNKNTMGFQLFFKKSFFVFSKKMCSSKQLCFRAKVLNYSFPILLQLAVLALTREIFINRC